MRNSEQQKSGSCLCGAVQFRISGPLKQVIGCHCTMCRKQTSHFLAFTAAWNENFELTKEQGLKWYRSSESSRRGFCVECGSVLFFATDGAEKISIAAGAFDGPTQLDMAAHIYVADKGDYYRITDDCPQYDQGGDNVAMPPRG